MPKFTKLTALGVDLNGFDEKRTLQVLQVNKKAVIYLVDDAESNVQVKNDPGDQGRTTITLDEVDDAKLSKKEKSAHVRKFVLTGKDLGATHVVAGPLTMPLTVFVVKNGDARLFDGGKDVLPPAAMLPLKAFGLRGAALRIAEDQLHSSIGSTSKKGAGMYMAGKNEDGTIYDWCGGFVQWCYQTAARLIGETNPFGDTAWALASPQRAISWAMAHPDLATVIRYEGGNPMEADGKLYGAKGVRNEKQKMNDLQIAAHGNPSNVIEGDICLVRNDGGGWQHVSMVYNVAGSSTFDTINGNPLIWIQKGLKYSDKVGKVFRYSFLHLSLAPVDWISGWMAESQVSKAP